MHWVGDRKVYSNVGPKTATVKVCGSENIQGEYEQYWRIPQPCTKEALTELIAKSETISDLERRLKALGASRELQRETSTVGGTVTPQGDGSATVYANTHVLSPVPDDPWCRSAADAVHCVIDDLVREFLDYPYLHRVEHSMHAHLYEKLCRNSLLQGRFPIGNTTQQTQLIHKEWPESIARGRNRRGLFDLAVVSPKSLASCSTLDDFSRGRLPIAVAMELGLNYDIAHLTGDIDKFVNSQVPFGFVVHLLREQPHDPRVTNAAESLKAHPNITLAYAAVCGRSKWYKLAADDKVTKVP